MKKHALIVDDNPDNQRRLGEFLHSRLVSADSAMSVKEAEEHLVAHEYDLVFLDLSLDIDEQDGIGILAFMDRENRRFPTVIVSVSASSVIAARAKENYKFVRLRLSHQQLWALADVLDNVIHGDTQSTNDKLFERIVTACFAVFLSLLAGFGALWILDVFSDSPTQTRFLISSLIVLACTSSLIHVFGAPVVQIAASLLRDQLNSPKSPVGSPDERD